MPKGGSKSRRHKGTESDDEGAEQAYGLTGAKVAHGLDTLLPGGEIILTLEVRVMVLVYNHSLTTTSRLPSSGDKRCTSNKCTNYC